MVELNCTGTVQLAKLVVQQMAELNAGKILFTASIAGEMVAPREAVYAATKAFVLSFAHSLRLRTTGLRHYSHRIAAGSDRYRLLPPRRHGQHAGWPEGKSESQPDDVARQGIDALFAGKDHVYCCFGQDQAGGNLANVMPGAVKGAMHEKMAKADPRMRSKIRPHQKRVAVMTPLTFKTRQRGRALCVYSVVCEQATPKYCVDGYAKEILMSMH